MDDLDHGKEVFGHDGELRRKDGSLVEVTLLVHQYIPEARGEPTYYTFVMDISERGKDRMELQEAKAQAELFFDLLSHDIHNMNRVSLGYLEMALGTARLSPGEQERIMTARGSLMNASRIIENAKRVQRFNDFSFS